MNNEDIKKARKKYEDLKRKRKQLLEARQEIHLCFIHYGRN
ncbi:MAG: hypothetical protein Q4G04_06265 [bacterium]|nr:hypothetical protein [bacterium]